MNELLIKYKKAKASYYQGTPIMTDEEFDDLESLLLEKGIISSYEVGYEINSDNTVKHKNPMLSLTKAKTEEQLNRYINNTPGSTGYTLEPKVDGLALSIQRTLEGNLIVSTRGNGSEGEYANHLLRDYVSIKGVNFDDIPNGTEIRGELYCSKQDLLDNNKTREELGLQTYPNERVAVSSILNKSKLHDTTVKLSFLCYKDEGESISSLSYTKDIFPNNVANNFNSLMLNIKKAREWLDNLDIPTDGVVIKPVNNVEMHKLLGDNNHSPNHQIAWKYPSLACQTTVLDIIYSAGKSGRITPIAIMSPVDIDGVIVSRATLHNHAYIQALDVRKGSIVEVVRSNDVIPRIIRVISNDSAEDFPEKLLELCPECGAKLIGDSSTLLCPNEECPTKLLGYLNTAVSKDMLNVDGLAGTWLQTAQKEYNITSVADLYRITEEQWVKCGQKSQGRMLGINGKKIYKTIQDSKDKIEDYKWLTLLGMPNISIQTSKLLISATGTLREILESSEEDLLKIKGIGEKTIEIINQYRDRATDILNDLEALGIIIVTPEVKKEVPKKGTFQITGGAPMGHKNRKEFISFMESKGFKQVNKKPDFLIVENANGNSSKLQKARKEGTKIVSWEELERMVANHE